MNSIQLNFLNTENEEYIDVCKQIKFNTKLNVISLFSGCGGMDLGFRGNFNIFGKHYEENPFEIIFANDIAKKATQTYELNFNHKCICEDIKNIESSSLPNADIVIGGFPCQDFSLAGNRKGLNAERGRLYLEMKRVIEHCKPLAFVAENVDGIRKSTANEVNKTALDIILEDFKKIGYNVKYKVLNAADYGVPQTRIRVIIIGVRNDLSDSILYPKRVHGDTTIIPWMTAKEAIDDLWDKLGYENYFNHSRSDYSKAKFYPNKKMQGNRRIDSDKPSITIRAEHHGNIEGHYRTLNPEQPNDMSFWRRLSVRECARLQTFPDNFKFPCSASDAYKQIGNAVPPILSWHIARALYFSLNKAGVV